MRNTNRRIKVYDRGMVYLGKQAKVLGFTDELVAIFTPEAILLVRPGTTARTLRRCIEVAALRMLAEEEAVGVESGEQGVERLARWVRARLEGLVLEVEAAREAAAGSSRAKSAGHGAESGVERSEGLIAEVEECREAAVEHAKA